MYNLPEVLLKQQYSMPKTHSDTVLITGCSSGIGYDCAHLLKAQGYQVIATARKMTDVDRLTEEGLQALQLDLNDNDSITEAVERALQISDGRLYGLFNNGAYGQPGALEDLSRDVLQKQLETNLLGWHELTRQIIPVMRKANRGRIIFNSSVLGIISLPFRGAYNVSKYATEGYADTLRLELHQTNIKVSLIEPGPITSAFRDNAYKAFLENVDAQNSYFADTYKAVESRLANTTNKAPFTLEPDAVFNKLKHALTSKKPKPRYYVTKPTHYLGTLKRILPTSLLDQLLIKISQGENSPPQ